MRIRSRKAIELDAASFAEFRPHPAIVRPAHEEDHVVHAEVRRDLAGIGEARFRYSPHRPPAA